MGSKASELITEDNVEKTYVEGKYVCFILKNGIRVKLNPNENPSKNGSGEQEKG